MRSERTLDDVLESAAIPDVFADYDLAESKRAIARDVTWRLSASPAHRCRTLHSQAARDLYTLSVQALRRPHAGSLLAGLSDGPGIEPAGALQFACLLNLGAHPEGAQFWWQFAAGAGSAMAAYCLYLLHLRRGELRTAELWAAQAIDLGMTPDYPGCPGTPRQTSNEPVPLPALRAVVENLYAESDSDYGTIPQPDSRLADQLRRLVPAL